MKKHILRAPGTDRYNLSVPNLLTDLDDYETRMCAGLMSASGDYDGLFQQPFQSAPYGDPLTELVLTTLDTASRGVTQGASGIIVPEAGLYLITGTVFWSRYSDNGGMSYIEAPDLDKRFSYILAGSNYSLAFPTAVSGDSLTAVLPMNAGDEARLAVLNNDSVNTDGPVLYASLSLIRVA